MSRDSDRLREEIKQTRPFRSVGQEATVAVLRTADVLKRRLNAVVEPHGLTLQQYNVLRILKGSHPEPLPTLEVGERMIERTPGVTRLMDRLVAKGLVERERSADDRRMVHCRITPEAMKLLETLDPAIDAADEDLVDALDRREARALIDLLERIRGP